MSMTTERTLDSMERIIRLGEQLLTTFDVEELLQQIVTNVQELLNAEGATLYLIDPLEKLMISQVIVSDRVEEIVLKVDNTSIAGFTALERRGVIIDDVYGNLTKIHPDLAFNKTIDEATHRRTRSMLTHPLVLKDELIGVFQVINKIDGAFKADDARLLSNFCVIAGIAILNARLMMRVMEEQSNAFEIVQHISDRVIIMDRQLNVRHMNQKAAELLPENLRPSQVEGRPFSEVFPMVGNLDVELTKVVDQNWDKRVSGGKTPFIILTGKNVRQMVERVILILLRDMETPIPEPQFPPPDPRSC